MSTDGQVAEFPGGVFDNSLADGRVGGTIVVHADRVDGVTSAGTFSLPLRGLGVELGGADGDMLLLRGDVPGRVLFSDAPGLLAALRAVGDAALIEACDRAAAAGQRDRRFAKLGWAGFLGAVVLAILLVPMAFRSAVQHGVDQLPLSLDVQLGDLAAGELTNGRATVTDEAVTGLIREIVQTLKVQLPEAAQAYEFTVVVVEDDTANAFALPGGRIGVNTGLIKKVPSVDSLAGVLAHELAHVEQRHGLRAVVRSVGLVAAWNVLVGDLGGLTGILAQGATMAVLTDYSREQESEADAAGARTLALAGFDPAGLATFFELLRDEPGTEMPAALAWLSSHPAHDERIAALEALVPSLERGAPPSLEHTLAAAQAALQ
jgi:predicted Zn-dependent protease